MQIKKTQPIKSTKEKWNVLVLGMDTMSRARFYSDMPQLAKYIQNHGWLDYRGYNKVTENFGPLGPMMLIFHHYVFLQNLRTFIFNVIYGF